jgi:serine phosphatase RsbU (regulator of sigma subunit)
MGKSVITYLITCLTLTCGIALCSCENKQTMESKVNRADSIIFDVGKVKDYERMRVLVDSFEMSGDISSLNANRWRGVSYYREGNNNMAEICYRKALECNINSEEDEVSYIKSARRLSEILLVKGDYEGSLSIAIPAVQKMEKAGIGSDIDYAILLNNIGCCQLNLGHDDEAKESFAIAREHYVNRWQSDSTSRGFQEAVIGTVYTSMAYINTRKYADAIYWIDRTEMLLKKYEEMPDARSEYFDEYQGRIEIMRAVALQGLGKPAEAAEAYRAFWETEYSKTPRGHINANDYLVAAERYAEAAYNYRYLDKMIEEVGLKPSLDNIQLYMLPKYRANAESGRLDSARVVGAKILDLLDSAIVAHKNSTTAELATIYDTNGKKSEIARQQADMARQRLIAGAVAMVLILTFFVIYTLHKRKSTHKLAAAHKKLQEAYDKLEETTAAKERIESELRIARDIQQSMVPSVFPNREGLDLFGAMKPAKAVGGDLFGYLLEGDSLYFCLGDVSGKGIPASLFMAQANRLFRTFATQQMMPAEILTRMNAALTEDNEQGMFVTMFIGLVDLKTGHLDFCNAGHNPPVILPEGKFVDVLPNAPIGLWPGLEYEGESIESIKGCPLFLYSDGLNEAENKAQEQFGDDHLLDLLSNTKFQNARQAVEVMEDEVEKFRDGAEPNDDLTMLGISIK